MVELKASTPQLKVVKKLMDAYLSLNMNDVAPLISKNYQYEALPRCTDFPKQATGSRAGRYKEIFAMVSKVKVTYHEVIEAPGKVILHVTGVLSTVLGATLNYDSIIIYTLVEEDGELKILHCKDFSDPQQRSALIAGTVKAAAQRVA